MSAEIHLIPDRTAVVQFFVFLTVLIGLSFLIFRPIKKILIARKARSEELLKEAALIEERVLATSTEYLARIEKAKALAIQEKDSIRQTGMKEERTIREASRKETQGIVDRARGELELSGKAALEELRKRVPEIANSIISKVKE